MKYPKLVFFGLSLSLTLALSACQAPSREPNPSQQSTAPVEQITAPVEQTTATLPASQFWDDVVELMNPAGDTTTVYKLEDGRYLDRMDRFFTYDGVENWTCDDGSIWHRKPSASASRMAAAQSSRTLPVTFVSTLESILGVGLRRQSMACSERRRSYFRTISRACASVEASG